MRIVQTNTIVNVEGFTDRLERGFAVRRENVNYEHVKEPVIIPICWHTVKTMPCAAPSRRLRWKRSA